MDMEKKLVVMEIERFAIHDGPGIRTTVFLKGCPLRCKWCANPESQNIQVQLLYNAKKCVGCGACFRACKSEAISFEGGRPIFHRDKCHLCKSCEEVCMTNAIRFSGKLMHIDEIVDIVLKDLDYYKSSDGGVTISGGEPFFQFSGFMALLKKCKEKGLHTAVETCGQYPTEQLKMAEPFIDLYLFDLKHLNPHKLFEYTGGDLKQILNNVRYISNIDPGKIIIRVPVIPGFNFDKESLNAIFNVAYAYGILNVHLLPYHTLGIDKYEQLGLTYDLEATKSLTKEELSIYKKCGEKKGLKIQIGG